MLLLAGGCVDGLGVDEPRTTSDAEDSQGDSECADLHADITADGMRAHLEALQSIANANGNRRSVGTPGYEQSVAYVRSQLEADGYDVTIHELDAVVAGEVRPTSSVLVETKDGDPDEVIMLGAHLDSVPTGPGINDNGTSVAALLEIAHAIQDCETNRRVRFAWWGAEEAMLAGSTAYVESLDADERDAIVAYLNFDMIGSRNYARFIYDGDGSASQDGGPAGSGDVEDAFAEYFDEADLATQQVGLGARSDYVPFADEGIAVGGLFTGAEALMTDAEAEMYGGQAGAAYDSCYHQACDDIDNVDFDVLETMAKAIAYAVEVLAM